MTDKAKTIIARYTLQYCDKLLDQRPGECEQLYNSIINPKHRATGHGTMVSYKSGCRCYECANAEGRRVMRISVTANRAVKAALVKLTNLHAAAALLESK